MRIFKNDRGFQILSHHEYVDPIDSRIVQQSSAIGDYKNSLKKPGSSFLWIGENIISIEKK